VLVVQEVCGHTPSLIPGRGWDIGATP
jgi:hypothetical protein